MPRFELVNGPMRAGKTTYALEQVHAVAISLDALMARTKCDMDAVLATLIARACAEPERDFVLDGWFHLANQSADTAHALRQAIPQTVVFTQFYAPMATLLARADQLDPEARAYQTPAHILADYRQFLRYYADELRDFPITFRTSDGPLSVSAFSQLVREDGVTATLEDVLAFEAYLAAQSYDTRYATIRLPHGRTLAARDEETLGLFAQVSRVVDWRGARVLDCGCYHGEIAFAAEDAGARRVLGVDLTAPAIATARRLKALWQSDVEFHCEGLETFTPAESYDVIVCACTLQYVAPAAQDRAVRALFAAGNVLVWETYADQQPLLAAVAQGTHRLILDEESTRWRPPSPHPRFVSVYERIAAC